MVYYCEHFNYLIYFSIFFLKNNKNKWSESMEGLHLFTFSVVKCASGYLFGRCYDVLLKKVTGKITDLLHY